VWEPATYFLHKGKTVDLIHNFLNVLLSTIKQHAMDHWNSSEASTQHHIRGTMLCNSRLFGLFLINSLTPTLAASLYSRIDSRYSLDGQLLFLALCAHIHCNHLAFMESIKNEIRSTTLADHKNDVALYLHFLTNNLCFITLTGDANRHTMIYYPTYSCNYDT